MEDRRKITVVVPADLLANAQKVTRAGISETVRKGLELLAASDVYDCLLKMRGKVKFSINLNELRRDRVIPQLVSRSGARPRR
jgi:hypothetical protein